MTGPSGSRARRLRLAAARTRRRRFGVMLALALPSATAASAQQQPAEELRRRVELLEAGGRLELADESLQARAAVAELYEAVSFRPLWSRSASQDLRAALRGLAADGLEPEHYHLTAIEALAGQSSTPASLAELDLLQTDALLLALHDVRLGRANPDRGRTPGESSASELAGASLVEVQRAITSGRVTAELQARRPHHFAYRGLTSALAELRRVQQSGGWPALPSGPPLRRDRRDPRVQLLRRRLEITGDLAPGSVAADSFDASLEAAVRRFQHRHGLNEDGVVGRATLAELNVPVNRRIEQVRVNLERARWVLPDLPDSFLVVNIAGAKVYLLRDTSVVFESRAVVGRLYTKTPVFAATLRYIDLNPSWTVPRSIVPEVLRRIQRSPAVLARERIRVLDRSGRVVDPGRIDFQRYSGSTFPFSFRQEPGPANPLGRLKFGLPNRFDVYLHDTPERGLFGREERTFSHGCIRVEDPIALAALVLDDPGWTRDRLRERIELGTTTRIPLRRALPVIVQYWTAAADLHGELHFYRDVYERDAAVLDRLNRKARAPVS